MTRRKTRWRCAQRGVKQHRHTATLVFLAHALLCLVASQSAADDSPASAREFVSRGMQRFQEYDLSGSISDLEQARRMEPRVAPHLWQLGICYYYSGDYQQGRRLFESHQTVNPHDVENAAWHFLCAAREQGFEQARKSLLQLDPQRDQRVPMAEIYDFYRGKIAAKGVLKAAEAARQDSAEMYAHLYLGLYYEVAGDNQLARRHLQQAAAARLDGHYMRDVARVHLRQRRWEADR